MSLTLVATPEKTVNNILANPSAAKSQLPYELKESDLVGKIGYKVEVQIRDVGGVNLLVPLTFRYAVENDGRIFLNIGRIVTDIMEEKEAQSLLYKLFYRDVYEGFEGAFIDAGTVQAIHAYRQMGMVGGSSMWLNLLHRDMVYIPAAIQENSANAGYIESVLSIDFDGSDLTGIDISSRFTIGQRVEVESDSNPAYNGMHTVSTIRFVSGLTRVGYQVPYTINTGGGMRSAPKSALLTKFKEPTVWRGWKRTVSHILDIHYVSRTGFTAIRRFFNGYNINKEEGTPIGSSAGGVTVPEVKVVTFPNQPSFEYIGFRCFDQTTSIQISEGLFFRQLDPCKNPIMIEWENSLGAPEQQLFSINQEVSTEASGGLSYVIPNEKDIAEIHGNKRRIFSDSTQSMILIAEGLTNNQIAALAEIKTSDIVRAYLIPDGSKTVQVVCKTGLATPYNSNGTRQEFRLVIEFPGNYNFYEAKEY